MKRNFVISPSRNHKVMDILVSYHIPCAWTSRLEIFTSKGPLKLTHDQHIEGRQSVNLQPRPFGLRGSWGAMSQCGRTQSISLTNNANKGISFKALYEHIRTYMPTIGRLPELRLVDSRGGSGASWDEEWAFHVFHSSQALISQPPTLQSAHGSLHAEPKSQSRKIFPPSRCFRNAENWAPQDTPLKDPKVQAKESNEK